MKKITPIILAGGSGKRLWPASSKTCPKQFCNLQDSDLTLFQETILRYSPQTNNIYEKPIIVTNINYKNFIEEQLLEINQTADSIIFEPQSRNTASSTLVGAMHLIKKGSEQISLVVPSDQYFEDSDYANKIFTESALNHNHQSITIFGIKITRPSTSYGYIIPSNNIDTEPPLVDKFIEKPNQEEAKALSKHKDSMWNCGIFLFKPNDLLNKYRLLSPQLADNVERSYNEATVDAEKVYLSNNHWSLCKNISIDYEILQRLDDIRVVPLETYWSDLGTWDSIWSTFEKKGNFADKNSYFHNCDGSLLRNYLNTKLIAIGLKNTVIVQTDKLTLAIDRGLTSKIDKILDKIPQDIIDESISQRHFRPWGYYENLREEEGYKVKTLHISPKSRISLQYHNQRSEHWTVLKGKADVEVDGRKITLNEGDSIDIPKKTLHRIENNQDDILEILEVQKGSYLKEDDIIRVEDDYDRVEKK